MTMKSDWLSIAICFDSVQHRRRICISYKRYGIGDINDIQPIGLKRIGSPSICRSPIRFRCILFYNFQPAIYVFTITQMGNYFARLSSETN